MFIRYLVALCFIALFAVAISVDVEVEETNDEVAVRANPAAKAVAKILGSIFAGAAASCLWEAAEKCKGDWRKPGKAISCGKKFLKENKGKCAAGR